MNRWNAYSILYDKNGCFATGQLNTYGNARQRRKMRREFKRKNPHIIIRLFDFYTGEESFR